MAVISVDVPQWRDVRAQYESGVATEPARRPAAVQQPGVAPSPVPLRITRRGRLVLTLLALAVVVGGTWWGGAAVADGPGEPVRVEQVLVEPGQTLWSLASGITEPGADVRDALAAIVELNRLADSELEVGQQVLLPVTGRA